VNSAEASTGAAVPMSSRGAHHHAASRADSVSIASLRFPHTLRAVKIFAYSKTDVIPVLAGIFHASCLVAVFHYFPILPWWAVLICGFLFSISISWNINGISHNFLHNPYFTSSILNRAFSWLESVTIGFSQQFYECVHQQHHKGNSDRKDEKGETVDWLSIYRFGKDGEAESAWSYTFLSFFRDDPKAIYKELKRKNPSDARFGLIEIFSFVALLALGFWLNWRFMVCFYLPFWYFGHCLSYLNGYYRHFGGNPDVPIAWGVSSYHKLYNLIWFNNGYHAEHHFRPKMHWTKMRQVHEQFAEEQKRAGVRVIKPPHALGFLDPDLPEKSRPLVPVEPKQG
jgi:fatty acid desaturase